MLFDSLYQHKMFQRMIPLLFRQSRVVQAGEPLKISESKKQRQLRWFPRWRWLNLALIPILICVGVVGLYFIRNGVFTVCFVFPIYMLLFEFVSREKNFIPFRWIIVRDGIWLRSSRDVSRFLSWRSIVHIDTEPKAKSSLYRIDLVTDEGERVTFKAKGGDLLPFVNKLLEILPHGLDPEPLQALQQRLRHDTLYSALFELRDSFVALGMFAFIPVFILLHFQFPVAEIGFATWGIMMSVTLLVCIGIYILLRRAVIRSHDRQVERILLELDETDVSAILHAAKSPRHEFGSPPRSISLRARRHILFSGEPLEILQLSWLFALLALMLGGAIWWTDPAEIRYGMLPFRWQKTHDGMIVAIADSSTERAPNGGPAQGGYDVITVEQTLPDGRTIRCRHPSWSNHGEFTVGQKVQLLRYANDETCLQIDAPVFRRDARVGILFILGFGSLFFIGGGAVVAATLSSRKRILTLLTTANVVKYRVCKRVRNVKTILMPLGGRGEPLELKSQIRFIGETVHVFLDEAKPKNSFVVESHRGEIRFDAETGELDCDPNPFLRYAKWGLVALAVGVGVIVLRLVWVW